MRILMVGSEAVPYEKTGGLADVLAALPRALARLGHQVDVVLPRYRGVSAGSPAGIVRVSLGAQVERATVFADVRDGATFLLVDHPRYFDRDYLYGAGGHDYPDNPERVAFLARAALEWAVAADRPYDVVHAHDWQAGLVPTLLQRDYRAYRALSGVPAIFTIHTLSYQGTVDASWLPRLGLGWDLMHVNALEFWGRISYLKGGIQFSRIITTVSPTYAREIQQPQFGFGFDGVLRARAHDLVGIVNGIDYDYWNPATDPHLETHFDAANLSAKRDAKLDLLSEMNLPETADMIERPLVAMISRLIDQKGFDLVAELADELTRLDATFVVLGTGERHYEDLWLALVSRHPDRVAARIGFNEGLAHRIEAGADLFLMPSRFEPCGLNQMYSLRYGTIPLVHATGGLYDTVRNLNPVTGEGTGFTFDDYTSQALLGTLRWALDIYKNRPLWEKIQAAGMREDFSWDASARQYVRVYERAVSGG